MKKYELYELQPLADNFIADVENIDAAVAAAVEYFTNKFKDLIVENTVNHQVVAENNQVQIEVGCLAKQGYIILDTFMLKKRNPFRETETNKDQVVFISKGFHLEKY